mgnify:CR=1 FL=1|jgi:hypothetical protein
MNAQEIVATYVANMTAYRKSVCTGPVVDGVKRAATMEEERLVRRHQDLQEDLAKGNAKVAGVSDRGVREYIKETRL